MTAKNLKKLIEKIPDDYSILNRREESISISRS